MNTHRRFMFNLLPSKNTNAKNTSAEIRRSAATEDATWFAKMDEKNKAIDRVGLTGLRPSALPHHRTCGFPHPAVEPSGLSPRAPTVE